MLTATPAVSRLLPWTTQQGLPQPGRPSQRASSLSGSLPTPTSLASPPPLLRSSRMQMPSKPLLFLCVMLCHAYQMVEGHFMSLQNGPLFPFHSFSSSLSLPLAGLRWPLCHWLVYTGPAGFQGSLLTNEWVNFVLLMSTEGLLTAAQHKKMKKRELDQI